MYRLYMHCKQFSIYEFQNRFSQVSLIISTKYFQKNRIIMHVLSGIMLFWREVQYLHMQPYSCQHREQHISKRNYEISVVKLQEIHISRLELQRWPYEFVIFYSKVYIWDLGLRFSFWDPVIQISFRQMHFLYIFSQQWKGGKAALFLKILCTFLV